MNCRICDLFGFKEEMIKINYTSLEISDKYNKAHKDVLEAIRSIIKRNPELSDHFKINHYIASNGKRNPKYIIDNVGKEILDNKFKYNTRSARFEYKFENELRDCVQEIGYEVLTQYSVCKNKYRIDFYIPEIKLAIEYDEDTHRFKNQLDKNRQEEISDTIDCSFIRIKEDCSIGKALGIIYTYILNYNKKTA